MEEMSLQTYEEAPRSAVEVRAQVNLIQEVMRSVMKNTVHFGTIPGCGPKPTLLKAGAEKLMSTFRLAADPIIDDLSTTDEARYRLTVRMVTASGVFVGAGIGEASSGEEKYKWRRAVCKEEWLEAPEDRKRNKWVKPYGKDPFKIQQVRTNVSDIANTVLKMAKKRALVDGVLTVTAASDLFTQDIEDMPKEALGPGNNGSRPQQASNVTQPKRSSEKKAQKLQPNDPEKPISEGQKKLIFALLKKSSLSEQDIKDHFDIEHITDLKMGTMNEVTKLISDNQMPEEMEPGSNG